VAISGKQNMFKAQTRQGMFPSSSCCTNTLQLLPSFSHKAQPLIPCSGEVSFTFQG